MAGPGAVLVDGYNVLHAIPRFAPRGRDVGPARDRFETWLAGAAARAGVERCVLVWDGRGGTREKRAGRLTILYTAAGITADDRLLDLCRGPFASRAASTWVVSSDGDVKTPAAQLGFTVLGAMEFYRRWSALPGSQAAKNRSTEEARARAPRASREEIDELLAAFLRAEGDPE